MSNNGDWNEWKRHVLAELTRHSEQQDEVLSKVNVLYTKVTVLETKAMILGSVCGALASLVFYTVSHFLKP